MEGKQLRLLGVLTAVLAVLVGLLYAADPPDPETDTEATAVVGRGFDPADAVAVELSRDSGEAQDVVALEKRDGRWFVVEPFESLADLDRTVLMIQHLGQIERGVPVEGHPADFGLVPPQVVARVTLADGAEQTLRFGSTAPVGHRAYMATLDGGVAAVRGNPAEDLQRRAAEYREHRVFSYDIAEVTRASITSGFGTLEARKLSEGWFLTGFGRVDPTALEAWLMDMRNLRVDLFLDLDHDTIADPLYRVEVETPSGTEVLLIGRDTPYGKLAFFGDGLDGVIDHAALQMLERGPSDVGVHQVFPFQPTGDVEIRLEGAREVVWTHSDGEWSMEADELRALENARFAYRLDPPPWTKAELTVVFKGQGGERRVEIGPVDTEGFRPVRQLPGQPLRVPVEELSPLFGENE